VPGAFRVHRDVCGQGHFDLIFVEAAVNDALNRPGSSELWIRGMEGIVRHLRREHPGSDIVMLHFADPGKIEAYDAGNVPPVIAAHEKVADRYGIPSVNLAREVAGCIRKGEFTWHEDFKDLHPSPFGHRFYAESIIRMLETGLGASPEKTRPEPLPDPLDACSYFDGRLVDVCSAAVASGWSYREGWNPFITLEPGQRAYFMDVPLLVAEGPAELTLPFEGRAVGIWMWIGSGTPAIEYAVDGAGWKRCEPVTPWSRTHELPWVVVLEDELVPGRHTLRLKTAPEKGDGSCKILAFVLNRGSSH
jgi:hypothetical protein